jgi:hypothetical protein
VIGGLIYGPLIARFAGEARGHGVPEVMLAVSEQGGRIRPRVAAVKGLASALCIGSGGSVGREGPIVQIGSALGSSLGQALRIPESRLRLLVACGAAGGISATFNAPIAGVFFALELILRDFESESFGVVVLASVIADVIGRAAFGSQPFLTLPAFQQHSLWEYGLYAGIGLLAAIVGTVFVRGSGEGRRGCARPPAASCSARCCSRFHSCTASATPSSTRPSEVGTRPGSYSYCSSGSSSPPASRSRSAAPAECSHHPCSWGRCSALPTETPSDCSGLTSSERRAHTDSSPWAPSSQPQAEPRSRPC